VKKRKLGSYYTPQRLANYIAQYSIRNLNDEIIDILEPSVGNGNFVQAISSAFPKNLTSEVNFIVVESELEELHKAIKKNHSEVSLSTFHSDYLDFHSENNMQFSLIIGNPPYVKSSLLNKSQRIKCNSIHQESNLKDRQINNIWSAFLVSAVQKLKDNGILSFVLPLELLQVKFSEEIRDFLKTSFARLEIFMFDELQFQECKGQDTVWIVGYKQHTETGTFYTTIKNIEDLEKEEFNLVQNISVSESNTKWTHHFLAPDEHTFLSKLKAELNTTSFYLNNKAGIVTAANKFFIVDEQTVKQYKLHSYVKPIVQKGCYVNGSITFEKEDFDYLRETNKPTYLLDFNNVNPNKIPQGLNAYLSEGVKQKLPERFKCKQRKHWYKIPNIAPQSEAFFFKRAHDYPKFLLNNADAYVTDSAYMIESNQEYQIENLVFSFYNSLTLAFAELEGRYYGGGVLEITPNEFRALPIPYIENNDFQFYKLSFHTKNGIDDILSANDFSILNTSLKLNNDEIKKIQLIRKKLINRRMKK